MKRDLTRFIQNRGLTRRSINKTRMLYRLRDPGWYLYRQVTSKRHRSLRFTDEFIELIYVTLAAWNMNSRGAKLAEWNTFRKSLRRHRAAFSRLARRRIERLSEKNLNRILENEIQPLFHSLRLVADSKPRLVTYSKTLHFILPNLILPIDRKYTLKYFYGHTNVPKSVDDQFKLLTDILRECRRFASSVSLQRFRDKRWNTNIPKIIDNMIIGYQK
jgi:hypothetical protein